MVQDESIIDEIHRIRKELFAEHGGLEGFVRYLQERQKQHPERIIDEAKLEEIRQNEKKS